MAKARSRWRWVWRLGVGFVVLLVAFLAWVWYQTHRAETDLLAWVDALRRQGEPVALDDLADDPLPDDLNAAKGLRAATTGLDIKVFDDEPRPPLTPAEREELGAIVSSNQSALDRLRAARAKAGVVWQVEYTSPLLTGLQFDVGPYKDLANLAGYDSLLAHERGDHAAALERVRDALFLSRALERHWNLIPHLVAMGISNRACEQVEHIVADLKIGGPGGATRNQVRAAIAELLDERAIVDGQRRAFCFERVAQIESISSLERKVTQTSAKGNPNPRPRGLGALKPIVLRDVELALKYTTQVIAAGNSPDWATADAAVPDHPPEAEKHRLLHLYLPLLIVAHKPAMERGFSARTERRLAATALALRWHAAEHDGALPERLEALVPGYLPAVPADLYAPAGQPIRYLRGERPVVYSVAENARDDGGSEKRVPKSRHTLGRWRFEDAVFRLTRPEREPALE
jgi:hypothetical protein